MPLRMYCNLRFDKSDRTCQMLPNLPKFGDAEGRTGRRRLSRVVTLDALRALQTETMNIQIRVMVVYYKGMCRGIGRLCSTSQSARKQFLSDDFQLWLVQLGSGLNSSSRSAGGYGSVALGACG